MRCFKRQSVILFKIVRFLGQDLNNTVNIGELEST